MKCETDDGRWNAIGWFEVEGNMCITLTVHADNE
jgi:uncharacterized membrane protein